MTSENQDSFEYHFHSQRYDFFEEKRQYFYKRMFMNYDGRPVDTFVVKSAPKEDINTLVLQHHINHPTTGIIFDKEQYINVMIMRFSLSTENFIDTSLQNNKEMPMNLQFLIRFFNQNPQYEKEILQRYESFFEYYQFTHLSYLDFSDKTSSDAKTLIKRLNQFGPKSINLSDANFEEILVTLKKHHATDNEIDDFFITFIKKRKTQLKNPDHIDVTLRFLYNYYQNNPQQLEKYTSFFPTLEREINNNKMDIIVYEYPFDTNIFLSPQKIQETFHLTTWGPFHYHYAVEIFCHSIKQYYHLEFLNFDYKGTKIAGKENCFHIYFSHSNQNFTKEKFMQTFVHFFNYLKENYKMDINQNNINNWISQYKLSLTLKEDTNLKTDKVKI